MNKRPFAELLHELDGLDEETALARYQAFAVIVEPFDVAPEAERSAPTVRISRKVLGDRLGLHAQPADDTTALRLPQPEELARWKRTPQQFVHPQATVHWLRPREDARIPGLLSLGRAPENDVVLAHRSVSKVHALLFRRSDTWLIEDYGSANGTVLNEQRLEAHARHALSDRDELRVGPAVCGKVFSPASLFRFCRLMRNMGSGDA